MKALVTGGNGFIGSHLVDRLLNEGYEVTCYVRKNSNLKWLEPRMLNPNLKVRADFNNHVDSFDKVYHIAGSLGAKNKPLKEYSDVHVGLTYTLLSKMKKTQHFIYMSSAWVNCIGKPYELTKMDGEYLVKLSGIPYTIVRPGFVYGERDMHLLNIFRMVKWLGALTPIIGSGNNKICPTYIKDVVDTLIEPKQTLIQVVGESVSVRQFMYSIADMMKIDRSRITVPVLPDFLKDTLKWDFFATERIFQSDIKPTPLLLGLTNTIKWYKENHYL